MCTAQHNSPSDPGDLSALRESQPSPLVFPPIGPLKLIYATPLGSGRAILHLTCLDDTRREHTLTQTQVLALRSDFNAIAQQ